MKLQINYILIQVLFLLQSIVAPLIPADTVKLANKTINYHSSGKCTHQSGEPLLL